MFDNEGMKQVVAAAVISALDDKAPALLAELVNKVLEREVNQYGAKPDYRDEKMTLLEQVARTQLEMIVAGCVRDWIAGKGDEIKSAVNAKLADGGMGDALVAALTKTLNDHRLNINLSVVRDKYDND